MTTCRICGETTEIPDGLEDTGICNICAQEQCRTLFTGGTPEQDKLKAEVRGILDQINKEHWLNVHFRAFELSHDAWRQHILANARGGSRQCGSPGGAVLDNERDGR